VSLIHVTDVEIALDQGGDGLFLGNLDLPVAGTRIEAHAVDVQGWVLGRRSRVSGVLLFSDGKFVRRVPVDIRRPDLAIAFPEIARSATSGFQTSVTFLGAARETSLTVYADLEDGKPVHIATVHARRVWRETSYAADAVLVSVVIPCYAQAHFLAEAIESVIAQTYPHFEVVVVDDGSPDNAAEVARRYPGVRVVHQPNLGLAAARNTGIRSTIGDFLVFLDADDRLLPNALATGLEFFEDNPHCGFAAGRCEVIHADGTVAANSRQPERVEPDLYAAQLKNEFVWSCATVMYRRSVFEFARGFETSVSPASDYDLYLRVIRDHPVGSHNEVVAQYRKHGASMGRQREANLASTRAVLRAQRAYVRKYPQYRAAYAAAHAAWLEYYGLPLVDEIRTAAHQRQWRDAARKVRALLRYYPAGVKRLLGAD